jgi:hypothetical protein
MAWRVLAEASRVVITWSSVPLYSSSSFRRRSDPEFSGAVVPGREDRNCISIGGAARGRGRNHTGWASGKWTCSTSRRNRDKGPPDLSLRAWPRAFRKSTRWTWSPPRNRFYQTHDDAYDYLVFYNSANVPAGIGVVAFEITTRSNGLGYGDTSIDNGELYGSKKRLQAVLNLGPLSQYPQNPNAVVPSRFVSGDTPLTILGHEAGHLFLALASVRDPSNLGSQPMLGRSLAHWAFPSIPMRRCWKAIGWRMRGPPSRRAFAAWPRCRVMRRWINT